MSSQLGSRVSLSVDVLQHVFAQLAGDYPTLCNIALTCKAWHSLSRSALLEVVDLSCHNNGRQPQHESNLLPNIQADFHASYRQPNLVPRQRAFLRLMTAKPQLAQRVKSLTWTLVWKDFEDIALAQIDHETWTVFSRMTLVTRLDLASLHDVFDDEYVRQNPAYLFPAVTNLRLLGWMHRGLVEAILTSLDTSRLRSLKLDYLEDEGAFPDGTPMNMEFAVDNAYNAFKAENSEVIGDTLFERQRTGKAVIFPGPMWLPLDLLQKSRLDSLAHLQIKLARFNMETDVRSYHTFFRSCAKLWINAKDSLQSLVISFGEHPHHFELSHLRTCGTSRVRFQSEYSPRCLEMTASFLHQQLVGLSQHKLPSLKVVRFEGFRILHAASPHEVAAISLDQTFQLVQDFLKTNATLAEATFTDLSAIDHRQAFYGYDCVIPELENVDVLLENS